MKKLFLLISLSLVVLLGFSAVATAIPPNIEWEKCYGDINSDVGVSILSTSDGGFVFAGNTTSSGHGYYDYWVVKISITGDIEWANSFGGTVSDVSASIIQTSDGGYAVAGFTRSNDGDVFGNNGNEDYWIIKITASGNLQWQKCFGGSDDDYANSILQTSDGGYLIGGSTDSENGDVSGNHGNADYWIIKINASGDLEWQKCYGGSSTEILSSVQAVSDGYVITGCASSNDGDVSGNHNFLFDYWIIKVNNVGDLIWQKCYGGSDNDFATSVTPAGDGGYVVAGAAFSNDGDVSGNRGSIDYWIIKVNNVGDLIWQKCYGGSDDDYANSILQTSDGGYLIVGRSSSNDGDVSGNHGFDDFWIVKISSSGILEWQKCYGGSNYEVPASAWYTSDGGLIVTGWTSSVDGDISNNHGLDDCWVIKFPLLSLKVSDNKTSQIKVYPNPFKNKFMIDLGSEKTEICLMTATGQILKKYISIGQTMVETNIQPGMYFLQLTFSDHSKKLIKLVAE